MIRLSLNNNDFIDNLAITEDTVLDVRLDNCSNDTINKIITSDYFPTHSATVANNYKIYCKQANVSGLTAPTGWTFTYVD